jgi:hypothetical protein
MLITAPDFSLQDELRVLALQGDWGLVVRPGPGGARLVVNDAGRAVQACQRFMDHVSTSDAHFALIPELAIPIGAVAHIIDTVRDLTRSLVFVGGIEGLTRQEYGSLLNNLGQSQALSQDPAGL